MNDYAISLDEIVSWLSAKKQSLDSAGVLHAGVHHARVSNNPSAFADYDTDIGIGRISAWVSGEIDFHVLRRSDGKNVMMEHLDVESLADPMLDHVFEKFLQTMANPDKAAI
ncbi:MAG TPA: hypothetical protein VN612_10845 [Acidobacteriaceae bacterium]|nr:hypothetical protein [Acidobacteriaceae bacterium]